VLSALPGQARAGCVVVGDRADIRSGSMAAGNFSTARQQYAAAKKTNPAPSVNLYLIPADARRLTKLTLTMERVGAGDSKRTLTSTSVQQADRWEYFAVSTTIPAPGTWRLRATSGSSSGCFDVTFG
jgi:hypothetical protein